MSGIPSNWRSPSINITLNQTIQETSQAIQRLVTAKTSNSDPSFFHVSDTAVYTQWTLFDQLTNSSGSFGSQILQYLQDDEKNTWDQAQFYMLTGYAAIRAYIQYRNPVFLEMAESYWQYGNNSTITAAQALLPHPQGRNITLGNCDLAGGTFLSTNPNENKLDSISTGDFLVLSSLLANVTSNSTYRDAAYLTTGYFYANFVAQNKSIPNGQFVDCTTTGGVGRSNDMAHFLEGIAYLSVSPRNDTLQGIVQDVVKNVIETRVDWQDRQGILETTSTMSPGSLMQALTAVYGLNILDSEAQIQLAAFFSVQFNAVRDLARNEQGAFGPWPGPPPPASSSSVSDDVSGVYALLGGLQVLVSSPTQTIIIPAETSSSSHQSPTQESIGAIVGGVLGGIAILSLIAIMVWLTYHGRGQQRLRRLRSNSLLETEPVPTAHRVQPYPPPDTDQNPASQSPAPSNTYMSSSISGKASVHQILEKDETSRITDSETGVAPRDLPTRVLVGVINERLQRGSIVWSENEPPPTYHGVSVYGDHS